VPARIDSRGEIETLCKTGDLSPGKVAQLAFRTWDDASPPFTIRVKAPNGAVILDRVIRELPTGKPQSPPPVTFTVTQAGEYVISIRELYGKAEGEAHLHVS
jgi:hypothetical protein